MRGSTAKAKQYASVFIVQYIYTIKTHIYAVLLCNSMAHVSILERCPQREVPLYMY